MKSLIPTIASLIWVILAWPAWGQSIRFVNMNRQISQENILSVVLTCSENTTITPSIQPGHSAWMTNHNLLIYCHQGDTINVSAGTFVFEGTPKSSTKCAPIIKFDQNSATNITYNLNGNQANVVCSQG